MLRLVGKRPSLDTFPAGLCRVGVASAPAKEFSDLAYAGRYVAITITDENALPTTQAQVIGRQKPASDTREQDLVPGVWFAGWDLKRPRVKADGWIDLRGTRVLEHCRRVA